MLFGETGRRSAVLQQKLQWLRSLANRSVVDGVPEYDNGCLQVFLYDQQKTRPVIGVRDVDVWFDGTQAFKDLKLLQAVLMN